MRYGGRTWIWGAWLAVMAADGAAAQEPTRATVPRPVLVSPVQGSESLRGERQAQVADAVRHALEVRGYRVAVSQELLGRAVVACQTPECVEQTLDAAGAELAVVPAIWSQGSDEELTLTLIQRFGRNLNASSLVGDDLSAAAAALVDEVLAKRAVAAPPPAPAPAPKHPHAWKAGPIILIAAGAAAFVAIGVGAATRGDNQQLNTTAVAVWSTVGAAAIGGGIAWWVVGSKRRRRAHVPAARRPAIALHPTGIDLRLRF